MRIVSRSLGVKVGDTVVYNQIVAYVDPSKPGMSYAESPVRSKASGTVTSVQAVEGFAKGHGLWQRLPLAERRQQLVHMIDLLDELYPRFRWFLFDGLKNFAAPYTIFGPTRGAVYIGSIYFVFNLTEHIRVLTRHFDALIRAAVIQPPDAKTYLQGLVEELEGGRG